MNSRRPLALIAVLALFANSCATQSPDSSENEPAAPPEKTNETSVASEEEEAEPGAQPPDEDGLELLEPDVTEMPSDEDMRATVAPEREDPVIAVPPARPETD